MCVQGQFPTYENDRMGQLDALITPHTPGILDLSCNIMEPTQILSDHLQYRYDVKIRVEVEPAGLLVDPHSIHFLGNYLSDPLQLILYAKAYYASRAANYPADAHSRYDLPAFPLPPSIEIAALGEFNTGRSRIGSFDTPPRYQRLSNGQSTQCDQESLVHMSFASSNWLGNDIMETQVKSQAHPASQPHQLVQLTYVALPQANYDYGNTETMLPAPSPPQIVDIIPRSGPHSKSQRVWLKVQNLPRGNDLHYLVEFGEFGIVGTSFVCSEEDEVQVLECATPITSTPCLIIPSLRYQNEPHIPLGSSDVYYEFASQPS